MDKVVVTGAARGLGLAICTRLLKDGFGIIGVGRKISPEFSELEARSDGNAVFVVHDFNDTAGIHDLVNRITADHGEIFGLVNNAAVGRDGVLATMHETEISEVIRVNIEAPVLLTKYVSRAMLIKRRGRIINISSIIARTGFNGLSVYGASKAALGGFTRSLARELGRAGITVNTVAPGYMETGMTSGLEGSKLDSIRRRSPLGKLVAVDDVAGAVAYLLSEDAAMVTGTELTVDAGSTA